MSAVNRYVEDLRAENARLREVVARVERLATTARPMWDSTYPVSAVALSDLLSILSVSSPSAERPYTETDGPAPAGAHAATEGAGDGV